MPVQMVIRGGKRYYRYGESGKEYESRAEAEKQGRAIRASQAREEAKKK